MTEPTTVPSSRREFIKTAAMAASAPFVACSRPERKLGFALVGLGSLSTHQLAPALQKTRHCRLAAIVTGTPSKAARWKVRHDLPDRSIYSYDNMERMSENPDIDVVYVVTPNALHAEHTITAARAGKHVLCEKPMEVSVAKCEAMIAACRTAGRQLAIGYRCQFEPHHRECVRLARERVLGDVRTIDAGFGFPIGDPRQWRLDHALAGGGALVDVGIYAVQAARMLSGAEPLSVTAVAGPQTDLAKFRDVEEAMSWTFQFPNGVIANGSATYTGGVNRVTAVATRGSFGMEPAFNFDGLRGWRSDGQPLRFPEPDQFETEMDDFARCILTKTPSTVSGEEGLRDVRILMAIYEAAGTGRVVTL